MNVEKVGEFLAALVRQGAVVALEMSDDRGQRFINGDGQRELLRVLRGALTPDGRPAGNTYLVTVNYDLSVEDMVELGKYDWTNPSITSEHFPVTRRGKSEVRVELLSSKELVGEVRSMSSDEISASLDNLGYLPVKLHELLAFGENHPEVQCEFPVVALGSVWPDRGNRYVPCLRRYGSERRLGLHWLQAEWSEI